MKYIIHGHYTKPVDYTITAENKYEAGRVAIGRMQQDGIDAVIDEIILEQDYDKSIKKVLDRKDEQ